MRDWKSIGKTVIKRTLHNARLQKAVAVIVAVMLVAGIYGYRKLSRFVDAKLYEGALAASVMIYSAPPVVAEGDEISPELVISDLRAAGYTDHDRNAAGRFRLTGDALTVHPGPLSSSLKEPVTIRFAKDRVAEIRTAGGQKISEYALEPQPLAAIDQGSLGRRRSVRFADIPKPVVHALLSAEDKHFFNHAGFDLPRVAKAALVNFQTGRRDQGGSTLTMQLARTLYLDGDKTWKRKITEFFIAEMLELKLTKEQIFENYVNHVYLGRANSMDVRGFAQAAETYFGKPLEDLSISEAATLAGLIQRPSYYDPIRHPERAAARRNVILRLMRQNGYLTPQQLEMAKAETVKGTPVPAVDSDAHWFLDLALDQLEENHGNDVRGRVYTTLDPDLQRAAAEAVAAGMKALDARLRHRKSPEHPQVALVAIEAQTGELKAIIGGRDFRVSQLNHALAMRQPGSVFKPFVYAAALDWQGRTGRLTAASTVADVPTTFKFNNQVYAPSNYGDQFYGTVTLRRALAKSLNIPTVMIAEQVGYNTILEVSQRAGMNDAMRATPAIALGAYEVSPLEITASYTTFANGGMYVSPTLIREVHLLDGTVAFRAVPVSRRVLSPEAAFIMHDMLEEVMRSGTAAGARWKLKVPAAGKTGTSRDGWFVGYVQNLICAVWIGYDSNRDLDLEGARSALPIWTAFMQSAVKRVKYRQQFAAAPKTLRSAAIDPDSGLLASPDCPARREYFIAGTEPRTMCDHQAFTLEQLMTEEQGSGLVKAAFTGLATQ